MKHPEIKTKFQINNIHFFRIKEGNRYAFKAICPDGKVKWFRHEDSAVAMKLAKHWGGCTVDYSRVRTHHRGAPPSVFCTFTYADLKTMSAFIPSTPEFRGLKNKINGLIKKAEGKWRK